MKRLRKPSKAARRRALAEFLAGLPEPAELPEECDQVADTSNTGSGNTCEPITIEEDGRLLTGSTWVKPEDFAEIEVLDGALPSVKGASPVELPALGDDQAGDGREG